MSRSGASSTGSSGTGASGTGSSTQVRGDDSVSGEKRSSTAASAGRSGAATVPRGRSGSAPVAKGSARRSSLTTRAVALAVVILMLTISYANSLRIYFAQSHEVAATKAEIADRQAQIAGLQTELDRWNDPAFVKLQARTRLGWVVPGEIGFTVVDADGKPLGGGSELNTGVKPAGDEVPESWYTRLWGSVEAADKPVVPEPRPGDAKPITEKNVDDAENGSR